MGELRRAEASCREVLETVKGLEEAEGPIAVMNELRARKRLTTRDLQTAHDYGANSRHPILLSSAGKPETGFGVLRSNAPLSG
jgi:hypothetical protein